MTRGGGKRLVVRVALGSALASSSLLSSPPARAQGVALSRFDPSERGSRFFVADSLELDHGSSTGGSRPRLAAGVASSFAYRARTFGSAAEGERSHLVDSALYLHPGGSVVIAPGARFALDLPIAAAQSGESTNLAGVYYLAPEAPRLGDLRASIDLRLFGRPAREGVTVAAGVRAWLPTGSAADFTGEDTARFGVHATSAARFGAALASVRVGYMYRREALVGGSPIGGEMNAAVGVAWTNKVWTIGPELYAASLIDRFFKTKSTPVEVLAGAHRSFASLRVGAGAGTSLVSGFGAAHVRALLSVEWIPDAVHEAADRDGDGVPDAEDGCPDVSGPRGGFAPGCPLAPRDQDADGIVDEEDACASAPGPRTEDPKTHGCPDADHDGVPDSRDACPSVAADTPSSDGCPTDGDRDGVPDAIDACPEVAGVRSDDLDAMGCPLPPATLAPEPNPSPVTPEPEP